MKKKGIVFCVASVACAAMLALVGCGGGGNFARSKDDQVVPKSGFTKYEGAGFEFTTRPHGGNKKPLS